MAESLENKKEKGTTLEVPTQASPSEDRYLEAAASLRNRDRLRTFLKNPFNKTSRSNSRSPNPKDNVSNDTGHEYEPPICATTGVNLVDSKTSEPLKTTELPTSRTTDAGINPDLDIPASIDVCAGGSTAAPSKPITSIDVDIQIVTPIAELWNQAYEELRDKEHKLIESYEREIDSSLSTLMDGLVKRKLAEDEKGKWMIPFGDDRIAIRELAGSVVSIIDWGQSFVGEALQSSPYGSLAWTGVCLLLPLILNPSKQRASMVAGLDYISDLLGRCAMYESGYHRRYETGSNKQYSDEPDLESNNYKANLKKLYIQILRFQALSVCQLSRNVFSENIRAIFKKDEWDEYIRDVKSQDENCHHLFDSMQNRNDLDMRDERHKQRISSILEKLDGLNDGLREIRDTVEKVHFDNEESKCFETLRTSDYQAMKDRNPEPLPGTCKWFLEHEKYHNWTAQPPVSRILWVSADPGCGKSVLSKTLVDQYDRRSVCYYFFKSDINISRSATHAICALLHQICSGQPKLIRHVLPRFRINGSKLTTLFEDLWSIFVDMINDPAFQKVICILDALDECFDDSSTAEYTSSARSDSLKTHERKNLLQKLAAVATASTSLKVIVTSRPYISIGTALFQKSALDKNHVHLTGENVSEKEVIENEISLFINSRVQDFQKLRESEGCYDDVHKTLESHLCSFENRTYLWVSAIFSKLDAEAAAPEWELMETIKALPGDVDKAYENILVQSSNQNVLRTVLNIMLAASRPLSLMEMMVALSIWGSPSEPKFIEPNAIDASQKWIRNLCGFFINVVDDYLYFVHETAREFLIGEEGSTDMTRWKGSFKQADSHTLLAQICIDYLSIQNNCTVDSTFNLYAHLYWVNHYDCSKSNEKLQDRIEKFMFEDTVVASSFKRWISNVEEIIKNYDERISQSLTTKLRDALNSPPTPFHLVCNFSWLSIVDSFSRLPDFDWNCRNKRDSTGLQLAATCGHIEIVNKLLAAGADVNAAAAKSLGRTALQAAAENEHVEIVNILLTAKADANAAAVKYYGRTALQAAAEHGQVEIVNILLAAGADVNAAAAKKHGLTALQAAAGNGHVEIVNIFLAARADINAAAAMKHSDRTALQAAAENGHVEIVNILLTAGADVNAAAVRYYGRTALQAAAENGHVETVNILLTAGADVNAAAAKKHGLTALQAAAGNGHVEIVNTFLAARADVNAAVVKYGRTALQAAAGNGNVKIVNILLAARVDVNADAAYYDGRTALQAAAENGHVEIVNILLTAKADANAAAGEIYGRTALQTAAENGHVEIVNMLLIKEADVNAGTTINFGQTALQAAAENGHVEIVNILLAARADVNSDARENYGQTALQAAAQNGHVEIVKILLIKKADVNAATVENNGRTALQAAAEKGHVEIVKILLIAKADANAAAAKYYGRTALQAAAENGHVEIVNIFLAAGADVNAAAKKYYGRTALQAAAENGHVEIVNILLAARADVNAAAAEDYGRTALQAAAEKGHVEIVNTLLTAGADVNALKAEEGGITALEAAMEERHTEIIKILKAAGAER